MEQGKYYNFKEVKCLMINAVDTDILDRLADLEDFSDHNGEQEELIYIQGTLDKILNDDETNQCTKEKIQDLYSQMREGNYEYLILLR